METAQRVSRGNIHLAPRFPGAVPRARVGVALTFLLTGLVFATWAARIPSIKEDLRLGDGHLAVAFVGLNAGAILGLQVGGVIVPLRGSRPALRVALPVFAVALIAIAFAPNLVLLTAALFVSAAINSVVDVAMNAHGVTVEQQAGRPLLAGFHAMHPLGGMIGGGIAALAALLSLGTRSHFIVVAVVVGIVAMLATSLLLPASADATRPDHEHSSGLSAVSGWVRGWSRPTLLFGVLAFCVTLAEGGVLDWGAVYLRDHAGATNGVAAAGVTAFLAGVTVGRLVGDQMIARYGPLKAFRVGGVVASSGFGLALIVDQIVVAVVGLMLLGLGLSYLLPLLFSAAGTLRSEGSAATVARVSTLGYLGSFVGPALIGSLSGIVGLVGALAVPAALVVGVVFIAGVIVPRQLEERSG